MNNDRPGEPGTESATGDEPTSPSRPRSEASTIVTPGGDGPPASRGTTSGSGDGATALRSPDELSVAPEDLTQEWVLHGCATSEFAGLRCPTLGRTLLLSKIGAGGMGTVYFGLNPRLDAEVAVKILDRSHLERNPGAEDRFLREARLAAGLDSPHLVRVLDVDRDAPSALHYIVMEYVHGQTARAWTRDSDDAVSESDALTVSLAAARGLAAIHLSGVIHRDIKPDNILLPVGPDGSLRLAGAKVADLGLARLIETGHSLTGTQSGLGTPGFMAPEQARDAKRAGKPADVFAVGATLYALLTGDAPFTGSTPMEAMLATIRGEYEPIRKFRGDVSPATAAVIDRCLTVEPSARFPDASALCEALEVAISATSLQTPDARAAISRLEALVLADERGKPLIESGPDAAASPPEHTARMPVRVRAVLVVTAFASAVALAAWGIQSRLGQGEGESSGNSAPVPPAIAPKLVHGTLEVRGGVPGAVVMLADPSPFTLRWSEDGGSLRAPAGTYQLRATAPGFADHEETIDLQPDAVLVVELPFAASSGTIDCGNAAPDVTFSLGGAPVSGQIAVGAGVHELVAAREGYWPQTRDVSVTPGAHAAPATLGPWEPTSRAGTLLLDWDGNVVLNGEALPAQETESHAAGPSAKIETRDGSATLLVATDDAPARERVTLGPRTTIEKLEPLFRSASVQLRMEQGSIEAVLGGLTIIVVDGFRIHAAESTGARFAASLHRRDGDEREIEIVALNRSVIATNDITTLEVPPGGSVVFRYDDRDGVLDFRSRPDDDADVVVTKRVRSGDIRLVAVPDGDVRIVAPPGASARIRAVASATRIAHLEDSTAASPLRVTARDRQRDAVDVRVGVGEFTDVAASGGVVARPLSEATMRAETPKTDAVVRFRFVGNRKLLERVLTGATDLEQADLQFVNVSTGSEVTVSPGSKGLLLATGSYQVNVQTAGASLRFPVDVTDAETELVLPKLVPRGMVVVAQTSTTPAFLIDRLEVSNAQYNEYAAAVGRPTLNGPPNHPAVGVPFADAGQFAKWAGKRLPTLGEWRTAAFGQPDSLSPRYPWGDREGVDGVHFVGGRNEPGPVDACNGGAAVASGALNMAGNAMEWLSDGWLIGGSYQIDFFGVTVDSAVPVNGEVRTWSADLLRDAAPGPQAYAALSPELRSKYASYSVRDSKRVASSGSGLRCVVPLE